MRETNLLRDELAELGVAVAQAVDGDAGREVEVLLVLKVPQVRTLATDEDGRRAGVRRDHVRLVVGDEAGGGRVGLGVRVREGSLTLGGVSPELHEPYSGARVTNW